MGVAFDGRRGPEVEGVVGPGTVARIYDNAPLCLRLVPA
jgi:hypothetical protein